MNTDKWSVLVVDDDLDILWSFGRHLLRCGFKVATCIDGEEAIATLKASRFDLMLTDLRMPKVDGLTLIDWARENRPDMRVVLVTGFGSQTLKNLSDRKAVRYLEKPVDLEDLVDTIVEILSTSTLEGRGGTVSEIDFLEYLQLVAMCGRKAVLLVSTDDGQEFRVHVMDGKVLSAEGEGLLGEDAFFKCAVSPVSLFVTLPWEPPTSMNIERPTRLLLSDAAQRRDRGE